MSPKPDYSCTECEEAFLDESALERHGQVLHGAPGGDEEAGEQLPYCFGGEAI